MTESSDTKSGNAKSHNRANNAEHASTHIDLDTLIDNTPTVNTLNDFLLEEDTLKALTYWVQNHCDIAQTDDIEAIKDAIEQIVADIDHCINDQLNVIIHHKRFQQLEASWRGLWYLVVQADGIKQVKIRILDISWAEVVKDIERALEFDQSQLFAKIYSDEYDTPGGEPYGAIIGDYTISHRPSKNHPLDDIAGLEGMAEIAAASFAPFIAAASSELFGIDDFADLRLPINLPTLFAQTEYIRWRALRTKVDCRFIGLTLPRILMRQPYRTTPGSHKGLFFYEKCADRSAYLWGNAAYAFGGMLIREFASVGWFGHIRGVPRNQIGGGLITNIPVDAYETDPNDVATKPVTDVIITDSIERDISNLGFIPLCQCYGTPFSAFYSNQSLHQTRRSNDRTTLANAKLSSMLQHVLCGSRVAHYIKVMVRDKIGSFITADKCEEFLRKWLHQYTTGRKDLDWEAQARFPLQESSVKVREHPDKPGSYMCVIKLVPYYQADRMVSELELVTELGGSGG